MKKIIMSMTTWEPRINSARHAMSSLLGQIKEYGLQDYVHPVLVLSEDDTDSEQVLHLVKDMKESGGEVLIDEGNIRSHKKLIPIIERYPDNAVLVVDDDSLQQRRWLLTFISDHMQNPDYIIYGQNRNCVKVDNDTITEYFDIRKLARPGEVTTMAKPSSGASGTLYPAHTFEDLRMLDRTQIMLISPTSDETWSFAFAVMQHRKFRCLSSCNYPLPLASNQECALWKTNKDRYSQIHNDIAKFYPEYLQTLKDLSKP